MSKKEILIITVLIAIALVRFLFFIPKPPVAYENAVGESVTLVGIVEDSPDVREFNARIEVKPKGEKISVLAIVDLDTDVSYGDSVKVTGILTTPENFMGSNGREFNYVQYLANRNIYFIIEKADVEVLNRGGGNSVIRALYKFRDSFKENITKLIPLPASSLMNGIILGSKGGFTSEEKQEFITTGTIHIIALSGYNVTIVAEGVMKFFRFIFRGIVSIWLGIITVILFVLLAGAQATAVRAGIMAFLALFARATGRTYAAGRGLIIAGLLMIAYDPRVITDISFQLSFLATIGVIFLTPKVALWFKWITPKLGLRENIAVTLSATIMVLPVLLYTTGVFSFVSLPANILILPLMPYVMLGGFFTGIIGYLWHIIALPFAYVSYLLLKYILFVIHFFASLPFASATIPQFPLIGTIILYIFIFWYIFHKPKKLTI
jgi:competence protein ComEC